MVWRGRDVAINGREEKGERGGGDKGERERGGEGMKKFSSFFPLSGRRATQEQRQLWQQQQSASHVTSSAGVGRYV